MKNETIIKVDFSRMIPMTENSILIFLKNVDKLRTTNFHFIYDYLMDLFNSNKSLILDLIYLSRKIPSLVSKLSELDIIGLNHLEKIFTNYYKTNYEETIKSEIEKNKDRIEITRKKLNIETQEVMKIFSDENSSFYKNIPLFLYILSFQEEFQNDVEHKNTFLYKKVRLIKNYLDDLEIQIKENEFLRIQTNRLKLIQ